MYASFILTIFIGTMLIRPCMQYSLGHLMIDPACDPRNCSQSMRPEFHDEEPFNCQIGLEKDWEEQKRKFTLKERYSESRLPKPAITGIRVYKFSKNPGLNITFQLPIDYKTDYKAILLKISSVGALKNTDNYYFENPQYRWFYFSQYRTSRDREHQRELHYNCFLAVQPYPKVYTVLLTAYPDNPKLPGTSLIHHVSYHEKDSLSISICRFPTASDIHVVFDSPSSPWPSTKRVWLCSDRQLEVYSQNCYDGGTRVEQEEILESSQVEWHEYTFPNRTPGRYWIQVIINIYGPEEEKVYRIISHHVHIPGVNKVSGFSDNKRGIKTDADKEEGLHQTQTIYVVIGISGGVLLSLGMFMIFKKRLKPLCDFLSRRNRRSRSEDEIERSFLEINGHNGQSSIQNNTNTFRLLPFPPCPEHGNTFTTQISQM